MSERPFGIDPGEVREVEVEGVGTMRFQFFPRGKFLSLRGEGIRLETEAMRIQQRMLAQARAASTDEEIDGMLEKVRSEVQGLHDEIAKLKKSKKAKTYKLNGGLPEKIRDMHAQIQALTDGEFEPEVFSQLDEKRAQIHKINRQIVQWGVKDWPAMNIKPASHDTEKFDDRERTVLDEDALDLLEARGYLGPISTEILQFWSLTPEEKKS